MDVRCSRCGTEYDFDDALVSERGTTVKCTNCGHQFKVYPGGGGGAPERWIVRKNSGRELVYTSLRDLQRAIAQRQVGPGDLLSRGGGHPLRALGAIAELEPFFHAHAPPMASAGPSEAAQRTLLGTGNSEMPTVPLASPDERAAPAPAIPTPAGGFSPPKRNAPLAPPKSSPMAAGSDPFAASDIEPATQPRHVPPVIPTGAPADEELTEVSESRVPTVQIGAQPDPAQMSGPPVHSSPSVMVHIGNAPTESAEPIDGITETFREYQDSFSDESFPGAPHTERPAMRWVVGFVLVGALAFLAGTVGMKYAKKLSAAPAPSTKTVADPRIAKLLEEGEALLSKSDFEGAKEQVDKASVLAEADPSVLSLAARVEASRADTHWLALKLIEPTHQAELDAERAELTTRLARVQKTAEAAAAAGSNDPTSIRIQVDALRLEGNVARARSLVGSLSNDLSQPETAYVLAALDLAEAAPAWPAVIDRLRTAAAAERGNGRARVALVYALASSGANDEATTELAKLDPSGPLSGLVARLRGFVQRQSSAAPAASGHAGTVLAGAVQPKAGAVAESSDTVPHGTDFRRLLEDASAAKKTGDLGRAQTLYNAAHDQQPSNVEAMAGLGDVARLRGDTATAGGYYDNALRQNPTYLPALIANADIKWASGDRVGALFLYKRIVNQTDPGSAYAQRAAARIAEAQQGASPGSGATPSPPAATSPPVESAKPPSEPPAKPPLDLPPNIDTTDLPGFK